MIHTHTCKRDPISAQKKKSLKEALLRTPLALPVPRYPAGDLQGGGSSSTFRGLHTYSPSRDSAPFSTDCPSPATELSRPSPKALPRINNHFSPKSEPLLAAKPRRKLGMYREGRLREGGQEEEDEEEERGQRSRPTLTHRYCSSFSKLGQ